MARASVSRDPSGGEGATPNSRPVLLVAGTAPELCELEEDASTELADARLTCAASRAQERAAK